MLFYAALFHVFPPRLFAMLLSWPCKLIHDLCIIVDQNKKKDNLVTITHFLKSGMSKSCTPFIEFSGKEKNQEQHIHELCFSSVRDLVVDNELHFEGLFSSFIKAIANKCTNNNNNNNDKNKTSLM